jgi:hypothetical protein
MTCFRMLSDLYNLEIFIDWTVFRLPSCIIMWLFICKNIDIIALVAVARTAAGRDLV